MSIQTKSRAAVVLIALSTVLSGGLASCAGEGVMQTGDPLTDIRNPRLSISARVEAADRSREMVRNGSADAVETRRVLKDVAWTRLNPTDLRLAVLEEIFDEDGMEADSRGMAGFLLPLEKDEAVVAYIAETSVVRGWVEMTPALVRCLARRKSETADDERPEAAALLALHPEQSLAQIVLDIFLSPGVEGEVYGVDWAELTRADAWDLLGRLDADGQLRAGLLESESYESLTGESAKLRDDLRACWEQLRTLPLNAAELVWLTRLRERRNEANEAWWVESTRAVAMVPQENQTGLRLHHIEPIRWAVSHHPQWLVATHSDLFAQLQSRLGGRTIHRRSERAREGDPLLQKRLGEVHQQLGWADLVTILVIDEVISDEAVQASLFNQAMLDTDDKTTEYGGTLSAKRSDEGDVMVATLFPPRPASRVGDERFVASADMLRSSDRALAHYHFHVQRWGNAKFAGPSMDDRVYAWRQGRACLVFTGIRKGVLGVDYYQPNGFVLDLGEIARP